MMFFSFLLSFHSSSVPASYSSLQELYDYVCNTRRVFLRISSASFMHRQVAVHVDGQERQQSDCSCTCIVDVQEQCLDMHFFHFFMILSTAIEP
jgi:hypothetical protein